MRYLLPCFIGSIVAACSYGSYDGSYDGGIDAGVADTGPAGTVVLEQSVDTTRDVTVVSKDGIVELTFPAGAFTSPTTVTITQLGERTVDALIVPIYAVTAPAPLLLPMQILFRGNNPNGGGTARILLVAQRRPDGSFAPTPIVSTRFSGGGTSEYWGLTKELGVFSLVFETLQPSNAFTDVSASSCIGKCCSIGGVGGGGGSGQNGVLTSTGIGCQGAPNASCFATTCPDFAAAIARANDLAKNNPSVGLLCRPYAAIGAQNCPGSGCNGYNGDCNTGTGPGGAVCCVLNRTGQCTGSGMGSQCTGIAIRCDLNTVCPNGTKCCAFDTDTYCTATCPNKRTLCRADTDCDGVGCQDAPGCPFRTCGPPPAACQ